MLPTQFIIPAAGAGSRFSNIGVKLPKPLIDIGGLPMILWVLGNFQLKSGDRVLIICQKVHQVPLLLLKYSHLVNISIDCLEIEALTDGPASTVLLAEAWLDTKLPVIIANSDQYVSEGVDIFVDSIRRSNFSGSILTMIASGAKWSYIERGADGGIIRVVEKIEVSDEATVGIYGWSSGKLLLDSIKDLIESNTRVTNEFYIAPTYNYLLSSSLTVNTVSVGTYGESVHGLGTPEDLDQFLKHKSLKEFLTSVRDNLLKNLI
jgi:dTDP-glucose pyrophosphorylase